MHRDACLGDNTEKEVIINTRIIVILGRRKVVIGRSTGEVARMVSKGLSCDFCSFLYLPYLKVF